MKIVKRMIRLLAAAAILCMLCIPAFAAEARTVYVADGGTGTGASVYALAEKRRCGDHAEVEVKGGLLIVDIVRDGKKCRDLLLTGPASMVCTGEIFDEAISQ